MAEKKNDGKKTSSQSKKTASKSSTKTNVNRVVKAAKKYDADKSVKDNSSAIAGVVSAAATSAKRAQNKKQRKFFAALTVILIIAIIAVAVYGYFNGWFDGVFGGNNFGGNEVNSQTYNAEVIKQQGLSIHFLELGNKYVGDSVYIKAGETDILIDAGSRQDSAKTITKYINQYVTDNKLEYVIATHAHEDHVAGFYSTASSKGIFDNFKVDTIIDFALSEKTYGGETIGANTVLGKYLKYRDMEIDEGAAHYTAAQCFDEKDGAKRVYQLSGDVELEILYNYYYFNYDLNSKGNINAGENNYSVCCMINHKAGDGTVNHYLFTGDLEASGEEKLVDYYNGGSNRNVKPLPQCVLYKAGHHGSKTSSTTKLMSAIKPKYVCVCTCAGTSEYTSIDENQFPTQDFIDRVAPYTDKVYVTSQVDNYVDKGWSSNGTVKPMNGNVVFTWADGKAVMYFSNNDILLKDTEWFKKNRITPPEWK